MPVSAGSFSRPFRAAVEQTRCGFNRGPLPTMRSGSGSVGAGAARGRITSGHRHAAGDGASGGTAPAAKSTAGAAARSAAATGQHGGQQQAETDENETFHAGILSMGRGPRGASAGRRRPASARGREGWNRGFRNLPQEQFFSHCQPCGSFVLFPCGDPLNMRSVAASRSTAFPG